MNTTSPRTNPISGQNLTFLALALMMLITRFHHEGTAFSLPDASLGAFFLAGIYLTSCRVFLYLLLLAFAIDYTAVTALGVSDYCFSPAYVFLVPTYAAMWWGGRCFERIPHQSWKHTAWVLAISVVLSASMAFLISNGSFYWFSGKLTLVGFLDYSMGLAKEYPPYLGMTLFYVNLGLGVEALLSVLIRQLSFRQNRRIYRRVG